MSRFCFIHLCFVWTHFANRNYFKVLPTSLTKHKGKQKHKKGIYFFICNSCTHIRRRSKDIKQLNHLQLFTDNNYKQWRIFWKILKVCTRQKNILTQTLQATPLYINLFLKRLHYNQSDSPGYNFDSFC